MTLDPSLIRPDLDHLGKNVRPEDDPNWSNPHNVAGHHKHYKRDPKGNNNTTAKQSLGDDYATAPTFSKRVLAEVEDLANNYRLTPATLYQKLDPTWIPKPFLLDASLKFAQAVVKGNSYIAFSAPPRHGKSRISTIGGPVWILENFPEKQVILTTYGADLSTDFGRAVRDIFLQNPHILNTRIRKDVSRTGHWMTTEGGGMTSVGIGGAITGRGADVLIVDDYIKTIQEAESKSYRNELWNWFSTTALTRVEPGGTVIILATRWNADDIIGRIAKDPDIKEMFQFIVYPALAGPNCPLGRHLNEPLFHERYPMPVLVKRRQLLGTHYFNALFQQEPESEDSKRTDRAWLRIVDSVPASNNWTFARIWDFAGTKNGGDHTVGTLCAFDSLTHDFIVIDVKRFQGSPNKVESTLKKCAMTDGPTVKIVIEEEPGSSGKHLIAQYQKKDWLAGYTVVGAPNTTSKLVRANPLISAAEGNKVFILKRPWNEDLLSEFDSFPDGDEDDQIDTLAIGYNHLSGANSQGATWGRGIPQAPDLPSAKSNLLDNSSRGHIEVANKAKHTKRHGKLLAISGDYRSKLRRGGSHSTISWGR